MTTIAADSAIGVMASDSWWTDSQQTGRVRKVFRAHGSLIGFAGGLRDIMEVRLWFANDCEGKSPKGDVTAIILRGNHRILLWSHVDGFLEEDNTKFAIGSGGIAARAAMLAGADCAEAVRIACRIDPNSGGRVRVYRLAPK